jgi:hypothetical protein
MNNQEHDPVGVLVETPAASYLSKSLLGNPRVVSLL